jgi:hypothetical protein
MKPVLFFLFSLSILVCRAQEAERSLLLFSDIQAQPTSFLRSAAFFTHYNLNVVLPWKINEDRRFYAGIYYEILTSQETINAAADVLFPFALRARHQSAGIRGGYLHQLIRVFTAEPFLNLGWANIVYDFADGTENRRNYAQIEPGFKLSASLLRNPLFHFGLGASYRTVISQVSDNIQSFELMGPSGIFFIRIGRF